MLAAALADFLAATVVPAAPYTQAYLALVAARERSNRLIRADRLLELRAGRWLGNEEMPERVEKESSTELPGPRMTNFDTKSI